MTRKIELEKKIEATGRKVSEALRSFFHQQGMFVVNFIGSPGAGKTALLEAAAPRMNGRAAVIEGDLQTDKDKRRIERAGLHRPARLLFAPRSVTAARRGGSR